MDTRAAFVITVGDLILRWRLMAFLPHAHDLQARSRWLVQRNILYHDLLQFYCGHGWHLDLRFLVSPPHPSAVQSPLSHFKHGHPSTPMPYDRGGGCCATEHLDLVVFFSVIGGKGSLRRNSVRPLTGCRCRAFIRSVWTTSCT